MACATFKPAVNEDEAAEYESLFNDLNEKGEVSDAATTATLGENNPSSGGLKLISACVFGASVLMSAIFVSA